PKGLRLDSMSLQPSGAFDPGPVLTAHAHTVLRPCGIGTVMSKPGLGWPRKTSVTSARVPLAAVREASAPFTYTSTSMGALVLASMVHPRSCAPPGTAAIESNEPIGDVPIETCRQPSTLLPPGPAALIPNAQT